MSQGKTVTPIEFVPARWNTTFEDLISNVTQDALLVSPYISTGPIDRAIEILKHRGLAQSVFIRVLTDLSSNNVLRGSTDPSAIVRLMDSIPNTTVTYLPNVHAKVYIADETLGIVTSGNLTDGGLYRNYEYGVRLNDPFLVREVRQDLQEYADLGNQVTRLQLDTLVRAAQDLKSLQRKAERQASREIRQEFNRRIQDTELELMRIRATGQTENAIFSATIIYLLRKYGALTTQQMHPLIQQIHPDICNDNIDRVINGIHFGKRWKHMARNAQQSLKKNGIIELREMKWQLVN